MFWYPLYRAHHAVIFATAQLSCIVSKLDYCNNLLAGCNKQLVDKLHQRVLNCAARVIFGGDRRDHITPLLGLRDKLHWLRARERITFKLCLLVYKAINGLAPSYLQDLCVPVTTASTRTALRCAAIGDRKLSLVPGEVSATGHFASLVP